MNKKSFLLKNSVTVPIEILEQEYNEHLGFNLSKDKLTPTVTQTGLIGTQSKTFAAPCDDDPDKEAEHCY